MALNVFLQNGYMYNEHLHLPFLSKGVPIVFVFSFYMFLTQ